MTVETNRTTWYILGTYSLLYFTKIRGCIETQVKQIIYFFCITIGRPIFSEGQVKRKLKKMKACVQNAIGEKTL
jgi:hypothetical protein